jgi:hypothetical protein
MGEPTIQNILQVLINTKKEHTVRVAFDNHD